MRGLFAFNKYAIYVNFEIYIMQFNQKLWFYGAIYKYLLTSISVNINSSIKQMSRSKQNKINDYTILKNIGHGEFGLVDLVQSTIREQFVIKSISLQKMTKDDVKNEALMHMMLDHPNILKAHECFFYDKQKYFAIVLDYCPDGDLSKKIGHLTIYQSQNIMKKILQAMVYIHDKKIVHRDLKPENIMMLNGSPKISDFGTAKMMKLTGLLSRQGAQNYMAPQRFKGQKIDNLYDVWSLGIIFMELLSGKRIHQMCKGMLVYAIMQQDFPSEDLLENIKEKSYLPLIKKMLQKDLGLRFTSVQALQMLKDIMVKKKFVGYKINPIKKIIWINDEKKDLIDIVEKNVYFPNLISIQLLQNKITDAGVRAIAKNAWKFPNLNQLFISKNKITDSGLSAFAEYADNFNKLKELCMAQKEITDKGFKAFVEQGDKFANLKTISFIQCKIGNIGLKALAENWQKFPKLQTLNLKYNQIDVEGLKQIIKSHDKFDKLQKILIKGNKIEDQKQDLYTKRQCIKSKIVF